MDHKEGMTIVGSDRYAVEQPCCGCGKPLLLENAWMEDGCPCNTPVGVNSLNLYRWKLLHNLQQKASRELSAANDRVAALEADGKRLREAIDPYHQRLLWNFAEGCYMHDMERKDLDALNAALSHEQQEEKREG